jgi:hypothetical protein
MIAKYLLFFLVVMIIGYFVSKFREYEQVHETNKEMKLIQSLLLNQSPLFEKNKPILWIHTKYERNARKWTHFYSRTTTDLNIPYIHLTVRTMIHHCGNDFNICLIDDTTFSKLIPSWHIDMNTIPEPMKTRARTYGFAQLLYHYGGMIVPNSFVCLHSLLPLFEEFTNNHQPFVVEMTNHTTLQYHHRQLQCIPTTLFMGVKHKNNETIQSLMEIIKEQLQHTHFQMEDEFSGYISQWCFTSIANNLLNLVNGKYIGTKYANDHMIPIEDLFSSHPFIIDTDAYGIWIPEDIVLLRTKYKWFVYLSQEEILQSSSSIAIATYIHQGIQGSSSEENSSCS